MLEPETGIERLVRWRGDVEDVPGMFCEDINVAVERLDRCR